MTIEPHPEDLRAHLTQLATDPEARVYAVIDGALFSNIKMICQDAGLDCRALYRDSGNTAVVLGGPWIVNPYRDWIDPGERPAPEWAADWESGSLTEDELAERMNAAAAAGDPSGGGPSSVDDVENAPATIARLDRILGVAEGGPGPVFWAGDSSLTEDILYRHLRRLNKVLVPKARGGGEEANEMAAAAADAEEIPAPEASGAYELAIFRHADANVMAQVVPALNPTQLSRLFGPCRQLLCEPAEEWGKGAIRASKPEDAPEPPTGPLRWEAETVRAIGDRRAVPFEHRLMDTLRGKYPDRDFGPDDEFYEAVHEQRQFAQYRFGVSADQHFVDYFELISTHGEKVVEEERFREVMARPGWSMEEKFQRLRRHYLPQNEMSPG